MRFHSLERSSALVVPVAFPPESRTSCAVDLHLPDNPNLSSSSASPVDFAPASFSIASCNVTSLKKNFRLLDFADLLAFKNPATLWLLSLLSVPNFVRLVTRSFSVPLLVIVLAVLRVPSAPFMMACRAGSP